MSAYASFEEFWPHYVREHAKPMNRLLHVVGTSAALCIGAVGLATWNPLLVALAPVVGYGAAWVGHRFFQTWPPAAFDAPWWSFRAGMRLVAWTYLGRMGDEVARATTATAS